MHAPMAMQRQTSRVAKKRFLLGPPTDRLRLASGVERPAASHPHAGLADPATTSSSAAAIQRRAAPTRSGLAAARSPRTVITEPVVPHESAARPIRTRPWAIEGA